MIQDIGLERYHCEYKRKEPLDNSILLCYCKNKVLLSDNNKKVLPTYGELKEKNEIQQSEKVYLFQLIKQSIIC